MRAVLSFLLLTLILSPMNVWSKPINKNQIRSKIITYRITKLHEIIVKHTMSQLTFGNRTKEEQDSFTKFVEKKFSIEKIDPYLIAQFKESFSQSDYKALDQQFNGVFFSKMYSNLLESILVDMKIETIKYKERRLELCEDIVMGLNEFSNIQTDIIELLGRLFYQDYNYEKKLGGLSQLELSLVFNNLTKDEKKETYDKKIKAFYQLTQNESLSSLIEFKRMIQSNTFQKYLFNSYSVFSQYYETLVEKKYDKIAL